MYNTVYHCSQAECSCISGDIILSEWYRRVVNPVADGVSAPWSPLSPFINAWKSVGVCDENHNPRTTQFCRKAPGSLQKARCVDKFARPPTTPVHVSDGSIFRCLRYQYRFVSFNVDASGKCTNRKSCFGNLMAEIWWKPITGNYGTKRKA